MKFERCGDERKRPVLLGLGEALTTFHEHPLPHRSESIGLARREGLAADLGDRRGRAASRFADGWVLCLSEAVGGP